MVSSDEDVMLRCCSVNDENSLCKVHGEFHDRVGSVTSIPQLALH